MYRNSGHCYTNSLYSLAEKTPLKVLILLTSSFSNFWSTSNLWFTSWKPSIVEIGNILLTKTNSSLRDGFSLLIFSSLTMSNTSLSMEVCCSMVDSHFATARNNVLVSEICKQRLERLYWLSQWFPNFIKERKKRKKK